MKTAGETKFKETDIGPIPEEWGVFKIFDVTEKVAIGPFGSSIKVDTFVNEGMPVISGQHLNGIKLEDRKFNFITLEHAEKLKNSIVLRGDVIFTHAGNIGQIAYIPKASKYDRYIISQRQFYLRCKKDKLIPEFITYFFKTNIGQHLLLSNKSQTGVPSIAQPVSHLRNIEIPLPTLTEQKHISEILLSLDDKIELNYKMNANLDKLDSSLFKQWFANFEFPNKDGKPYKSSGEKMVDSELGEIPEGWKVVAIKTIAEVIDCLHSKKPESVEHETPYTLLQLNNISENGLLNLEERYSISEEDYKKWISRMEGSEGDCIITNVGRVGAFSRIPAGVKVALGRNMTGIRANDKFPFKYFLAQYFLSDLYNSEVAKNTDVGTILNALNVKNISKLRLVIPEDSDILEMAEGMFCSIWQLKENHIKNNYHLSAVRNSLLPRLMSGKIRVK